jgi:uncharacterized phosphatase
MSEFYFIRHGQTDHNISKVEVDHREDIALNETGKQQAKLVEPLISSLPVQTICSSPLKRALETKQIISAGLRVPHHQISDLGECPMEIWREMERLGMRPPLTSEAGLSQFIKQVGRGIEKALSLPGPSLVVAHGGVHWALCCLLQIEDHSWAIDNCVPVYFRIGTDRKWTAQILSC